MPGTEGAYLSTDLEDVQGNRPYQVELDGINASGQLYYEYYFKELRSDRISHKLSYAKLYEPYDWVVATGVHLDDVDLLISEERASVRETYQRALWNAVFIAILGMAMTAILFVLFDQWLSKRRGDFLGRHVKTSG